jgi:hypothetical protein
MIQWHRSMAHGVLVVTIQALFLATLAGAEPWTRAYVDVLPDEAFAAVHVRPDGTKSRHLPHHDADGRLDLPHLRSALARLDLVHWEDPADAERARQHLLTHRDARREAVRVNCSEQSKPRQLAGRQRCRKG